MKTRKNLLAFLSAFQLLLKSFFQVLLHFLMAISSKLYIAGLTWCSSACSLSSSWCSTSSTGGASSSGGRRPGTHFGEHPLPFVHLPHQSMNNFSILTNIFRFVCPPSLHISIPPLTPPLICLCQTPRRSLRMRSVKPRREEEEKLL